MRFAVAINSTASNARSRKERSVRSIVTTNARLNGAGMLPSQLRGSRHGMRTEAQASSDWFSQAIEAGTAASLISALMLALAGQRDAGSAVAALNAPGHWLFGRESLRADRPSWRHTLSGLLIHHGSSLFWGLLYSRVLHRQQRHHSSGACMAAGLAGSTCCALGITALAAWVDLRLVPKRLTPGFEHRLSNRSLVLVYAAFAVGLAVGAMRAHSGNKKH